MKKSIALIDCNSFYCSCERLFRPELNNKAIVVLSNNDGCAISRTAEAKRLGIKMGEPFFKFKNLINQNKLFVFSSNFALYTDISKRVMLTIASHSPEIEVYSVDEAFADFTGIQNLSEHAHFIKNKIMQDTGIPVGVGIGPTKVLAKVANHLAKKSLIANGVVNLTEQKFIDIALKRIPIEDVWGIGRASSQKLINLGIKNGYDFCYYKNEEVILKTLSKTGLQIKHELMGINCFGLNEKIETKKEIMCSRTFGVSLSTKDQLKESIANYICDAAEKLRKQNSLCSELNVFARTNPFNEKSQYFMFERLKLINPTCDSRKLISEASRLVEKGYKEGFEYKKAGIKLSSFNESTELQLDMFQEGDSFKSLKLMETMDKINYIEGKGSIQLGACGLIDHAWRMNRNHKSPRYTTSWNDLKLFNANEITLKKN